MLEFGEIDLIYNNLGGDKRLKIYPLAGHENYLNKYGNEWRRDVQEFMGRVDSKVPTERKI